MKGIKRFRQAIKNQQDFGNGEFRLAYHDAEEIADEIEDELARLAWAKGVSVPKDADGKVVPLDTEKLYTDKGEMVSVDSICYGGRLWHVRRMHSDKTYWLDSLHLRRPDSWGKLEEDVQRVKETGDICGYYDKVDKLCDECPALNIPGMCSATVLRDVLLRAKALAERDAKEADRD